MIFIAIILGCIIGVVVGNFAPNKKFDMGIFISGFFGNAILAILLAYLGQKLNVDIYLVAIFVFVSRMFNNLGMIRRYYLEKFRERRHKEAEVTEIKTK